MGATRAKRASGDSLVQCDFPESAKRDIVLDFCEAIAGSSSIDDMCYSAVRVLAREFRSDNASVGLFTSDGEYLVQTARYLTEYKRDDPSVITQYPAQIGRMNEMIGNRVPVISDFTNPHPHDFIPSFMTREYCCCVSVPIFSGPKSMGYYSLIFKEYRKWSTQDFSLLITLGGVFGSYVYQAFNLDQRQQAYIAEEYKKLCVETNRQLGMVLRGSACQLAATDQEDEVRLNVVSSPSNRAVRLTDKEVRLVKLVAKGLSNAEIAKLVNVSEITVKKRISALLEKLKLNNRVQLAVYAVKRGYF